MAKADPRKSILLDIKVETALARLAKLNMSIDQMQERAQAKYEKQIERSIKNIEKQVHHTFKSLGEEFGLMVGSVALGLFGAMEGLKGIGENFRELTIKQATIGPYKELSEQIVEVSHAFLDLEQSARFVRQGKGIGMTDAQIKGIAQMGSNLALMSAGKFTAQEATGELMKSIVTGQAAKGMKELDSATFSAMASEKGLTSNMSLRAKQQTMINDLLSQQKRIQDQTSPFTDTPFMRLSTGITLIQEKTKGLLGLMKGLGVLVGGALAPIAAGLAGFALGGPIIGALGTIVGGILSASLVGFGGKLTQMFMSKSADKNQFGAIIDLIKEVLGGLLETVFSGGTKFDVADKLVKEAFGTEDIQQGRQKLKGILEPIFNLATGFHDFIESFFKGFMGHWDDIKANFEKMGISLGGKGDDIFKKVGETFGNLAADLIILGEKVFPKIVAGLGKIAEALGSVVEHPAGAGIGAGMGSLAGAIIGFNMFGVQGAMTGAKLGGALGGLAGAKAAEWIQGTPVKAVNISPEELAHNYTRQADGSYIKIDPKVWDKKDWMQQPQNQSRQFPVLAPDQRSFGEMLGSIHKELQTQTTLIKNSTMQRN